MSSQSTFAENEKENSGFEYLPSEVILIIFKYCSDSTLCKLSETCKRFNRIINDVIWQEKSRNCLATNQLSEEICIRSHHMLSGGSKRRISINWIIGRYKETLFALRERQMPWLLLDSRNLWMSKGKSIQAFRRKADGLKTKPRLTLNGHSADVCRFAMTERLLVSGGRDGLICGWCVHNGDLKFSQAAYKNQDVRAVDINSDVIVSGSSGGVARVWRVCEEHWRCHLVHQFDIVDGIWSVAIGKSTNVLCVGSSGCDEAPLHLYDMGRGTKVMELHSWRKLGAGVLDIHWESPYAFLSAGYDTYLRLWDIRTGKIARIWEDPYDSTVYCIGSDKNYTMLCGTNSNGRVQLWDKRRSQSVQKYFMEAKHSSPVYSLVFDPCNLYAVLDTSLHLLDFSVYKNSPEAVLPARKWTC